MTPSIHHDSFVNAYRRYIGPLSKELPATLGMNQSTHVAYVCLSPEQPTQSERAVVKHFRYSSYGWVNEYVAWILAQQLGVRTAPRAALLIGQPQDLTPAHGPELNEASRYMTEPLVLWCTSAVEPTQPVQQAIGRKWETVALRIDSGKRLGAMDGWLGNCDRIAANTLYWTSGTGGLVAIDHEKMAFNCDWTQNAVPHLDEIPDENGKPKAATKLIDAIINAKRSKEKSTRKAANTASNDMFSVSKKQHPKALDACKASIESIISSNFNQNANNNFISFLNHRISDQSIKQRYGVLI